MFTKPATLALSAILALGIVSVGHSAAAQAADTVSVTVHYGDLNLNSPAGANEMHQRIQSAARAICGPEPTAPLERLSQYAPCVKKITDQAIANLNDTAVASRGAVKTLASNR